jgi:DNA-binding NtrC family response regulator
MLELVRRVAPSETTALLLGESGTGKELAARAIHDGSPRRRGAFVAVECSGLTEGLFESELFGHEKGAFTGAVARREGLVAAARGGTLFLDEIGDIPPALQVKLLRLLETRMYRRVGGTEPQQADFRLVCATHRDLPAMVAAGEFRADLYYRVAAFPIRLPALRERREDLPLLVGHLLSRIPASHGKHLTAAALGRLEARPFPGNVRELRNLLERACLLADGELIGPEHLEPAPPPSPANAGFAAAEASEVVSLVEMERRYLADVLAHWQGDRRELAARLGVSERTLFRKLRELKEDEHA